MARTARTDFGTQGARKNGKAIRLKGYDSADIVIEVKNKKTGQTCDYELPLSR